VPRRLGSAGYSHADESALGARNSVGVGGGHAGSMPDRARSVQRERLTDARTSAAMLMREKFSQSKVLRW
jgi:hypothetical protein